MSEMTSKNHPEDFVVEEPLILINVRRTIGSELSVVYPQDVYAAVQGWWVINSDRINPDGTMEGYKLVLARNSEHILGAFRPEIWRPAPHGSGRWGFVGHPAEMSVQLQYVGKRVPNAFRTQSSVRYLNPGDN